MSSYGIDPGPALISGGLHTVQAVEALWIVDALKKKKKKKTW